VAGRHCNAQRLPGHARGKSCELRQRRVNDDDPLKRCAHSGTNQRTFRRVQPSLGLSDPIEGLPTPPMASRSYKADATSERSLRRGRCGFLQAATLSGARSSALALKGWISPNSSCTPMALSHGAPNFASQKIARAGVNNLASAGVLDCRQHGRRRNPPSIGSTGGRVVRTNGF
jgi:hypothetical protein